MKKILMTLSLALAAVIALPSVMNAQDNATQQKAICKEAKCKDGKACKEGKQLCGDSVCPAGQKALKQGKHKGSKKGDFKRNPNMKRGDFAKGKKADMKKAGGNPLMKGITLSEEQQQQYKALQEKRRSERQAAKEEVKKEKLVKAQERSAKMKAEMEVYEKEVEKILTPEQMKQYNANKENMQKAREARGKR